MTQIQLDNVAQTFEVSKDKGYVTLRRYSPLFPRNVSDLIILTANDIGAIVEAMGNVIEMKNDSHAESGTAAEREHGESR